MRSRGWLQQPRRDFVTSWDQRRRNWDHNPTTITSILLSLQTLDSNQLSLPVISCDLLAFWALNWYVSIDSIHSFITYIILTTWTSYWNHNLPLHWQQVLYTSLKYLMIFMYSFMSSFLFCNFVDSWYYQSDRIAVLGSYVSWAQSIKESTS